MDYGIGFQTQRRLPLCPVWPHPPQLHPSSMWLTNFNWSPTLISLCCRCFDCKPLLEISPGLKFFFLMEKWDLLLNNFGSNSAFFYKNVSMLKARVKLRHRHTVTVLQNRNMEKTKTSPSLSSSRFCLHYCFSYRKQSSFFIVIINQVFSLAQ